MATIAKGTIATYTGGPHFAFRRGQKVRVNHPITDDDGQPTGRYDVSPWIEKDQRFSWIASDAQAKDLEPITAKED